MKSIFAVVVAAALAGCNTVEGVGEDMQALVRAEPASPGPYLAGLDLARRSFAGAALRSANLENADLRGANFAGADLRGASLRWADIRGASFAGARLEGADLTLALVDRGTSFDGAAIAGCTACAAAIQVAQR